jgi:HK97 family phage prohead protease/HK97 family phage major capsid protein
MQTRYTHGPDFTLSTNADGDWIIEGYASTDAVDSYNEIIEPEAFRKWLPRFMEFPVSLVNHAWFDKPIGKILDAAIDMRGLWVRALISKTAPDIWQLIQEGILKAFSVGFSGVTLEKPMDDPAKPAIWKEVQLLEVSIVNVPANREALFSIATSKSMDLSRFKKEVSQPITTKTGGSGMSELTPEQVKAVEGVIEEKTKNLLPSAVAAASANTKTAIGDAVTQVEVKLGSIQAELKSLKDSAHGKTESEVKEMIEKALVPLSPLISKYQRENASGLSTEAAKGFYDMRTKKLSRMEVEISGEQRMSPEHVRALIHRPNDVFVDLNGFRAQAMRNFHEASDTLYILDVLASASGSGYAGPKSLKFWKESYLPALNEFRRAMDTATTAEGTEWVPTMMTASFLEIFELERQVARQFTTFPMPSKVYDWPVQSGTGTSYLPGESTSDSATAISASTPGTRKTTFTAKKLAARFFTSTEWIEDAAIEAMSFLQKEIANTLARGEEDAIVNGDTAGTHQDSNVTAADDRRKAWLGIRAWCHDQTNTTDHNAAITTAGYMASRKSMGKYAVDPRRVFHLTDPVTYLTTVALAEVQTYDKFGPLATILNGALVAIGGIALFQSEFVPVNLNASGLHDAVTTDNTVVLTVAREEWKIGTRRQVTVKVDDKISTDQFEIVGTMREDFQPMRATDHDIAWERFNVTYP